MGQCHQLRTVVLTWCVQLTDAGVVPLAQGCSHLELLSMHGIRGITQRCCANCEQFQVSFRVSIRAAHGREPGEAVDV